MKALNAAGAAAEGEIGAAGPSDTDTSLIERHLERVTTHRDRLELRVWSSEASASATIVVPWSTSSPTRNRQIMLPKSAGCDFQKPIRTESRARLVEGIAKGRHWLGQLTSGEAKDTREIAHREGCSERSIRMTLSLAFVSPAIAKAAIDGSLPAGLGVAVLTGLPDDWRRQAELI
jgi:hypothetical protein